MNFTHPFFPRHQFLHKGGGSGDAPELAPAPVSAPAPTPTVLQTPAPAAPSATAASPDVMTAKNDAKKAAAKKKGLNSTILGDPNALGGAASKPNTLLGGG
jgi:hypothetical protein